MRKEEMTIFENIPSGKVSGINYREARLSDIPAMRAMFQATLRHVNVADYSHDEIEDWVSCGDSDEHWNRLLSSLYFVVACDAVGRVVGFTSMRDDGYLHSMFVSKDYQRRGIGNALLSIIERYAKSHHIQSITTEVSVTARPFFVAKGYVVATEQMRRANHMYLKNFLMCKDLL